MLAKNREIENILRLRCDIVTQCVNDYRACLQYAKMGKEFITLDGDKYEISKMLSRCEKFLQSNACVELGGINGTGIMKIIQQQELGVVYE